MTRPTSSRGATRGESALPRVGVTSVAVAAAMAAAVLVIVVDADRHAGLALGGVAGAEAFVDVNGAAGVGAAVAAGWNGGADVAVKSPVIGRS